MTLRLESGLQVRLAGVASLPSMLNTEQSQRALAALTEGHSVGLRYGGDERDRYGRAVAQLYLEDGRWVQGEMVSAGWLLAESIASDASQARALQALEADARQARRGHWETGAFTVFPPDPNRLAQHLDTFQIVEGIVVETAEVRDWRYLNFGLDYSTDFTVAINRRNWAEFEASGMDLDSLSGARIRVRGWLEPRNGPMITVDHPEQIEALD